MSHPAAVDQPQRLSELFRILLNCGFFGSVLPSVQKMVAQMRLPKRLIEDALVVLVKEEAIALDADGHYRRIYPANVAEGVRTRIGVLTERNIFMRYFEVYQDYLIGLGQIFGGAGLDLVFAHELVSAESKIIALEELIRAGVTGFVIIGRSDEQFRAALKATGIPAILCGNTTIEQRDFACVCSDNLFGMKNLVARLQAMGHRRIAYYTTASRSHEGYRHRIIGYRNAMEDAQLETYEELIQENRHSPDSARLAAEAYLGLQRRSNAPTAVVCACDREAFELISELEKLGIQVPGDVSVAGFENSLINALSPIPLTTVDIFALEMGRMAGELLLLELKAPQQPVRVVMPSLLLERASVVPPGIAVG
ncbi:LacI family DNA-binding transcriptional regulator [Verrucomicrobium sp. GAS474]|uniref:LacI family DNA-binding transcriptional regulator n=1 Tax=Verrucomicrobium sp. GAS474 TaxID=1882831 RepID=UPI0012FFCA55|nr:LacI family DNA-binding transcriptional regulator [Verrucomicrobium sp. GAS474]